VETHAHQLGKHAGHAQAGSSITLFRCVPPAMITLVTCSGKPRTTRIRRMPLSENSAAFFARAIDPQKSWIKLWITKLAARHWAHQPT
jgi:hypothetical protein